MTNTSPRFNLGFATASVSATFSSPQQVVQLADGGILVAGLADDGTGYRFCVAKFTAEGILDTSFAATGITTVPALGGGEAYDLVIDAGGNIIVAGLSDAGGSFALVRLLPSGEADTSFGVGGVVIDLPTTDMNLGRTVLLDDVGNIILVGTGGPAGDTDFILRRYDSSGNLDTTFGTGGLVRTEITGTGQPDTAQHAVMLADGKIIVVGSTFNGHDTDAVIVRYNSDGSIDATFNASSATAGMLVSSGSSADEVNRNVAVLPDGSLVVVGGANAADVFAGGSDIRVMKYDSTTDTVTYLHIEDLGTSEEGRSVCVLPDGRFLVAGISYGGLGEVQCVIAQYDEFGALDTAGFGNGNGYVITNFPQFEGVVATDITFDLDGNILLTGSRADTDFVVLRFTAEGRYDTNFGEGKTVGGTVSHDVGHGPTLLDGTAQVYDDEFDLADDYGGSSLRIERDSGADSHDTFVATGNLGALTDGTSLLLGGNEIGNVSQVDGLLVLTFSAGTTRAQVNEVMSSIAYQYVGADAPPASIDLLWKFDDNDPDDRPPARATITVDFATGPGTYTLDWSDMSSKLTAPPELLNHIEIDVTNNAGAGTITEFNAGGTTSSDTVSVLVQASGGPSTYSQTDNFIINGTTGNDIIKTSDGNDIVTTGGGEDSIDTGGGDDVVKVVVPQSTGETYRQFFYLNTFDAGAGNDRLEVSGASVDLGGLSSASGDGPTRALLGFEDLVFTTQSADGHNQAYLRIADVIDADGIHQVTGSSVADTFEIGPEPETYPSGLTIDISGMTFLNWNSDGQQDTIAVTGTGLSDTITGNNAGFNRLSGGLGNDVVHGGDAGNTISGGGGTDDLYGGLGQDSFEGGAGADNIYGTAGSNDVASYASSVAGVTVNLLTNVHTGGDAQGDKLYNINGVVGSESADKITGNNADNLIVGNGGDDLLYGRNGIDTIYGGEGNDKLYGENDNDTLHGENGNDTLYGGTGNDDLYGGDGTDVFYGGAGADNIYGGTGTSDIAYYNTSTLGVTVNLVTNFNSGGEAEGDKLYSIERVQGSNAADTITGDGAVNTLYGNGGNDSIAGGMGADLLFGGAGSDSFVFSLGDTGQAPSTYDQVKDYQKGAVGIGDEISFATHLFIGGSQAAATVTQASIDAATGIATFAAGSGRSQVDALADIAARFTAAGDSAGEFALFRINATGDYYVFISDGLEGVTATDSVIRLNGITSVTSINVTDGDLTLLA